MSLCSEGVADCIFSWFYCCCVVELLIFANCEGVTDAMRLNCCQLCIWMHWLGHCDNRADSGNSQEPAILKTCKFVCLFDFFCFVCLFYLKIVQESLQKWEDMMFRVV
jgi:hypothetical protein